jgi:hypothetical protein
LEYVLLLSLALIISLIILRTLFGTDPTNPEGIKGTWIKLINAIAGDLPDK